MKAIAVRVALIGLVIGGVAMAFAQSAEASHVTAEIDTPAPFEIGKVSPVQVTLDSADDGQPVAGAVVTFYTDASFGGVAGEVKLGSATTDETGVAVLEYEPRTASVHDLRIEYLLSGESEPEVLTRSVTVVGTAQLHQSTSGVQIPGLNVWFIIAVIGGVWAMLFSVGWRVFAVARAHTPAEPLAG